MRTTITLDDDLMADAAEYSGIEDRATLIRHALKTLVQVEAERRLALLKGSLPDLGKVKARRRRLEQE